jgi:hypothetical protein
MVPAMDAESALDPVLPIVERFLVASQMAPTAFGQIALNDPNFVHELRNGRECKRATRARVLGFIETATAQGAVG